MGKSVPPRATAPSPPATRRPTARELDQQVKIRKIDRTAEVARHLVKYGSYALSWYFVATAARVFAGERTLLDFGMNIAANFGVNEWAGWLIAGLCGAGWMRQRKVHHDYIERTAPLVREAELAIDSGRSSSGLTSRGLTHPGDVQ